MHGIGKASARIKAGLGSVLRLETGYSIAVQLSDNSTTASNVPVPALQCRPSGNLLSLNLSSILFYIHYIHTYPLLSS